MRPFQRLPLRRSISILFLTAMIIVSFSSASAGPQVLNVRLSGLMPDFSSVGGRTLSPDGKWVVFTADREADGISELYSVPITGGVPTRLSGALVANGEVWDFKISPDSQLVVFRADKDLDQSIELYSVSIDGSDPPVKLNTPITPSAILTLVSGFEISSDSEKVLFFLEKDGNQIELYNTDIGGGTPRPHAALDPAENGEIFEAHFTPDSQHVLYLIRLDDVSPKTLYSAPILGGFGDELTPMAWDRRGVSQFKISGDGNTLVYTADKLNGDAVELYSVSSAGGTSSRINPAFANGRSIRSFDITPNSLGVVYNADQETADKVELYSAPIAGGGTSYKLNQALVAGGNVIDFKISGDSGKVVYRADSDINDVFELFKVGIYGANRFRLHPPLETGREVTYFHITPNSLGVVFKGEVESSISQLYSNLMDGSTLTPLTNITSSSVFLRNNFEITPDSLWVVFIADMETLHRGDLWSVSSLGGSLIKWNVPLADHGCDVASFIITPDSAALVYTADAYVNDKIELFHAYPGFPNYLPAVLK